MINKTTENIKTQHITVSRVNIIQLQHIYCFTLHIST